MYMSLQECSYVLPLRRGNLFLEKKRGGIVVANDEAHSRPIVYIYEVCDIHTYIEY